MSKMASGVLAVVLLAAGCGENADKQNRLKTYGAAPHLPSWPADGEAVQLVDGTIAQGAGERERALHNPPPLTTALLQRGRQQYDIYCAPCHGLAGDGDGIVVARGFPQPKPFADPALIGASSRHLIDVISNGSGRMYGFSDRVEPQDRWAIAAYIRALQMAEKGARDS